MITKVFFAVLLAFAVLLGACEKKEEYVISGERVLMGTRFAIQLVVKDTARSSKSIEAAFDEIEALEERISEWRQHSEISELNRGAGDGKISVGHDLFEILERGQEISRLTDGAFDMTFAGCGGLWSISERQIPTASQLAECRDSVDYRRVQLSPASTEVSMPVGTRVGIAAIGKGYAVDIAAAFLKELGYQEFLIEGGGDIRVSGKRLGRPWTLGITHPRKPDTLLGTIELTDGALATSGDYESYFELDGVRYHHILDPRTAMPGRKSIGVSVVAPNAMDADAFATAFFVMGGDKAVELAETLPGVEVLVVDSELNFHASSGFNSFFAPQ